MITRRAGFLSDPIVPSLLNRRNLLIADSESPLSQSVGATLTDQNNISQNVSQSLAKQDEEVSFGQ